MHKQFIKTFHKYRLFILSIISFFIPLIFYLLTLEKKLVGGDTSWFAIQIPSMEVLAPTGYPAFSILGKLFSMLPFGDIAYRLNFMSAFFGALTVLFLFLALTRFIKNQIISLVSALTFSFLITFWSIANRFEMDTINSFFIALLLFAIFLYSEQKKEKYLYFCFAAIGLSLANHPLALFVMPGFLIYIIILNPKIFKSARTVLLSILFFILPLFMYFFIPIRSLQGHGPVDSVNDFILYITGRYSAGEIHGGSFFDNDLASILKVIKEFFGIVYLNYGIVLLLLAIIGLVYLFIKDLKFGLCSILIIVSNFTIISMFIDWTAQNHVIDTLMIVSVYLAMGLLFIIDMSKVLIKKITCRSVNCLRKSFSSGNTEIVHSNRKANQVKIRNITTAILIIIFFFIPFLLALTNYHNADSSQMEDIYLFWDKIFSTIEDGSSIYVASLSANIGKYINIYEKPQKKVDFIMNKEPDYSINNIRQDLDKDREVYLVNIEDFLLEKLNLEVIFNYYWPRFEEGIVLYKVNGINKVPVIDRVIGKEKVKFGEKFSVEYKIINKNDTEIKITSLELFSHGGLDFEGLGDDGNITDDPSLNQDKYLWVKDYIIGAGGELNIVFNFRAARPGKHEIKFGITSQNTYFSTEDVVIEVLG